MRHQHIASLGALLVAVALVVSGCAQPTAEKKSEGFQVLGSASGRVIGADGLPLKGVKVTYNTGSRAVKSVTTNEAGVFEVTDLPSGSNKIYIGGEDFTIKTVTLSEVPTMETIVGWTNVTSKINVTGTTGTDNTDTAAITVGDVTDGQYWIDTFGVYRVNQSLSDIKLYSLSATIKGKAVMETLDAEYNKVTSAVPEGFTIGIQVSDPGFSSFSDDVYAAAHEAGLDAGAVGSAAYDAAYDDYLAFWSDGNPSTTLEGLYTTKVGKDGAFTIEKLPASFPTTLVYNFFIISSDNQKSAVAYKIDSTNWFFANQATNAKGAEGFETALIADGIPVDTGTVTFKASIKPVITDTTPVLLANEKFLPLDATTGAIVPLTFTFSKPMNPLKGTLVVSSSATDIYTVVKTWDATGKILTVTPTVAFEYGKTITAAFSNFESAAVAAVAATKTTPAIAAENGVAMTAVSPTFVVRDALKVISTSYYNPLSDAAKKNIDPLTITTATPIVLTFNFPITTAKASECKLKSGTKYIDATFTPVGSTLTMVPAVTLNYGATYSMEFEVTDGVSKADETTALPTGYSLSFTTTSGAILATPVIAKDNNRKISNAGRIAYNDNDQTYYISVPKAVADTTISGFSFQYKKSTDLVWTDVQPLTPSVVSATTYFYSVTSATPADMKLVSGETMQIRAIANSGTGYLPSLPSNVLEFTDGVAPASATLTGFVAPVAGASTTTLNNNTDTSLVATATYTIALVGGTEKLIVTMSAGTAAPTGFYADLVMNTAQTLATVTTYVSVATSATVATDPSGQYVFALTDAALNPVDFDAATAGVQNLTVTF